MDRLGSVDMEKTALSFAEVERDGWRGYDVMSYAMMWVFSVGAWMELA